MPIYRAEPAFLRRLLGSICDADMRTVADALLTQRHQSLANLAVATGLSGPALRAALLSLAKHHLVVATLDPAFVMRVKSRVEEDGKQTKRKSTDKTKVTAGSRFADALRMGTNIAESRLRSVQRDASFLFSLDTDAIRLRLWLPRMTVQVRQRFGEAGVAMFRLILQEGRARYEDVVEAAHAVYRNQVAEPANKRQKKKKSSASLAVTQRRAAETLFETMRRGGYLAPTQHEAVALFGVRLNDLLEVSAKPTMPDLQADAMAMASCFVPPTLRTPGVLPESWLPTAQPRVSAKARLASQSKTMTVAEHVAVGHRAGKYAAALMAVDAKEHVAKKERKEAIKQAKTAVQEAPRSDSESSSSSASSASSAAAAPAAAATPKNMVDEAAKRALPTAPYMTEVLTATQRSHADLDPDQTSRLLWSVGVSRFLHDQRVHLVADYARTVAGPVAGGLIRCIYAGLAAEVGWVEPTKGKPMEYRSVKDIVSDVEAYWQADDVANDVLSRLTLDDDPPSRAVVVQTLVLMAEAGIVHGRGTPERAIKKEAMSSSSSGSSSGSDSSEEVGEATREFGSGVAQAYCLLPDDTLAKLKAFLVRQHLLRKHGKIAARIYAVLEKHRRLEEQHVAMYATCPRKHARALLMRLRSERFICVSEVSRTTDRSAQRTFFLWGVSPSRVTDAAMGEQLLATWLNLKDRREAEVERVQPAEARQQSRWVPVLEADAVALTRHRAHCVMLDGTMLRVADLVFLFRDWS